MGRSSRFLSGISASYIGVAATIVYSLAIVPIGLRYLGVEQFGLWMLLVQISGYLTLIELGIFGAAARILIDHKDHQDSNAYAGVVATAWLILAAQGALMAAACWFLAPFIVQVFNIPPELQDVATFLLRFLGLSAGLATCFKIFSAILYAHQRIDVVVLFTAQQLLLALAITWSLLASGHGLWSLPWAFIPPVLITFGLSYLACRWLGFLPARLSWRSIRFEKIRELFKLGADFFLVNVGTQLLEASQLMIVSRTMGLTAAATWSVSTKLFALLYQLIAKVENTAVVFFSEMMVRGEHEKLRSNFQKMYQFTGSLAVCGMLGAVAVNPYFVAAWAGTGVLWPAINNWLIAGLLVLNLLLRCHTDFAMHTKKVGLLRFLFFFESLTFVALALWAAPLFGFSGILVAALACALVFRASYSLRRTASYFSLPTGSVAIRWLAFLVLPAVVVGLVAAATSTLVDHLHSPVARLLASITIATVAGGAVLCSIGLPSPLRHALHEQIRSFSSACLAAFRT
jgi:O-antigen/teichoic acid export membrane protein